MSITRDSLMTLEAYAKARKDIKAQIIPHRRLRSVALGEHITVQFEDEKTIRYQIQEMLRVEKIFDEDGINHEIEAYTPLVPDGTNWKATMLIEYPDPHERKRELARLIGIEDRMFVEVEGHARVHAIADEDLPRENDEKTSSVHFIRFELPAGARRRDRGRLSAPGLRPCQLSGARDDRTRDAGKPGRGLAPLAVCAERKKPARCRAGLRNARRFSLAPRAPAPWR
jgi:hypothetical protein